MQQLRGLGIRELRAVYLGSPVPEKEGSHPLFLQGSSFCKKQTNLGREFPLGMHLFLLELRETTKQ